MKGYWRIEKEWLSDFGLTPSEAVLLADMLSWNGIDGKGCTHSERAERCCMDERTIRNLLPKIAEKFSASERKDFPKKAEIFSLLNGKVFRKKRKKLPKKTEKVSASPHTPYNKEEKHEEHEEVSEARTHAREKELIDNGTVETVKALTEELVAECRNGGEWIFSIQRLYGINAEQVEQAVALFSDHLTAGGITLKSRGDFRRHFRDWLKFNVKQMFFNDNNKTNGVTTDFIQRTAQHIAANGGLAF